jgi:hypothetical protein
LLKGFLFCNSPGNFQAPLQKEIDQGGHALYFTFFCSPSTAAASSWAFPAAEAAAEEGAVLAAMEGITWHRDGHDKIHTQGNA